jgi:hypothetical protein
MNKVKNKSRLILMKVFGGVFLCSTCLGNDATIAAAKSTKDALMITTGIKAKVDALKAEYRDIVIKKVKGSGLDKELLVLGLVTKGLIDERIEFTYEGKTYVITNNSIQMRMSF